MNGKSLISTLFMSSSNLTNDIFTENPNPKFSRINYINLNGYYKFIVNDSHLIPSIFDSEILVPYVMGSKLSGIENSSIDRKKHYHYHLDFDINEEIMNEKLLLHFERLSGLFTIYINGIEIKKGTSILNLTINIKDQVQLGNNKLDLDFTFLKGDMLGIIGSVYLDSAGLNEIKDVHCVFNYNDQSIYFNIESNDNEGIIRINYPDGHYKTYEYYTSNVKISLDNIVYWDKKSPFFYSFYIENKSDKVQGIFILTKIELGIEDNIKCLKMNNSPLPIRGVVDNFYNIDGINHYESYSIISKIFETIKLYGFNSIYLRNRIECPYYYYLTETKGILIAQNLIFNDFESFDNQVSYLRKYSSIYLYIVENNSSNTNDKVIYNLLKNKVNNTLVIIKNKNKIYGDLIANYNLKKSRKDSKSNNYNILLELKFNNNYIMNYLNFFKGEYYNLSLHGFIGYYYSSINNPQDGIFTCDYKHIANNSKILKDFFNK